MSMRQELRELVTFGLSPMQRKLCARLIRELELEFFAWQRTKRQDKLRQLRAARRKYTHQAARFREQATHDRRHPRAACQRDLFSFLRIAIDRELRDLLSLDQQRDEFRRYFAAAPSPKEREQTLRKYAELLNKQVPGRRQRRPGRCFDDRALLDQFAFRQGCLQQGLMFKVQRLGHLLQSLKSTLDEDAPAGLWQRLELDRLFSDVLHRPLDPRVHAATLRTITMSMAQLPFATAAKLLSGRTMSWVQRAALDPTRDACVQTAALDLCEVIAPAFADQVLQVRLQKPAAGDDLFVRRHAVRVLASRLSGQPQMVDLLQTAAEDPSVFVRQQLATTSHAAPMEASRYWLRHLTLYEHEPKVRAAAVAALLDSPPAEQRRVMSLDILADVLDRESDELVLRAALHVVRQAVLPSDDAPEQRSAWDVTDPGISRSLRAIQESIRGLLRRGVGSARVARWAAQALLVLEVCTDAVSRSWLVRLRELADTIRPGGSRKLPRDLCDEERLGRVLAVLALNDFGFDVVRIGRSQRLVRGPVFGFRWWRFWHEILRAAPDKRQGAAHTEGRLSRGAVRAPSALLAELSPTRVPGEPLYQPQEDGWRHYLPLVDDLLSALQLSVFRARTVRFFHADGITELTPPGSPLRRLWAAAQITRRFRELADLRNWHEGDPQGPEAFVTTCRQLGFRCELRPYAVPASAGQATRREEADQPLPTDVGRCFPVAVVASPLLFANGVWPSWLDSFWQYFASAYENSLTHLMLFLVLSLSFFLIRHWWSNRRLRRARRQLGICIGGWGTRGKSGSERLKAALINGLGFGLVSKSTGCEALFLVARPFGELHELPLYRPYEKATIWEQRDLLQLAAHLGTDAFLWECMGLSPQYVDVLQGQWTRDDLSTITNTYPDHEDLQGPSGYHVAQSIAGFTPTRARLLTTERQMVPVLRETSRRRRTSMCQVPWLEAELLPEEILNRFPYQEHPENIALILAMARDLGCDQDLALKEMADRLVPDVGVLKTFPPASHLSRTLEFANGMSANERFGCLGNWQRLGFDQHDPLGDAGTWISTVVNNRGDRAARSRVFAQILAHDISAHRHFLIGDDVHGLKRLIVEAWERDLHEIRLWPSRASTNQQALARLTNYAQRLLKATTVAELRAAAAAMLRATWQHSRAELASEDIDRWLGSLEAGEFLEAAKEELDGDPQLLLDLANCFSEWLEDLARFSHLQERVQHATEEQREEVEQDLRSTLTCWFVASLVTVDDPHAKGEQLVEKIVATTPPGFRNRIMGLQNIKGVGMDFVQRWFEWERCHDACSKLNSSQPAAALEGIEMLLDCDRPGVLAKESVRTAVERARSRPYAQREQVQADLDMILQRVDAPRQAVSSTSKSAAPAWVLRLLDSLEGCVDVLDAIRRRRRSERVYRDLVREALSLSQAAESLRDLNRRQAGGWLKQLLWPSLQMEAIPEMSRSAVSPRDAGEQQTNVAARSPHTEDGQAPSTQGTTKT